MPGRTETIRNLNDALRTGSSGDGQIMITRGVQALGASAIAGIRSAVARFDTFDPDNDPYGEHDFGAIDFEGNRIFWKIDVLYEESEVKRADGLLQATRVLTLMLADDW